MARVGRLEVVACVDGTADSITLHGKVMELRPGCVVIKAACHHLADLCL